MHEKGKEQMRIYTKLEEGDHIWRFKLQFVFVKEKDFKVFEKG